MTRLIRTTVTGGLVFLLPFAILAYFAGKILTAALHVVQPISAHLPVKSVAGVSATVLVAILGIILVSFLAGLLAQSRMARHVVEQMETHLLGRIPAYGLLKSLSNDVIAPGEGADHPVVLVHLDDSSQFGILIGPTADGNHRIVFIPDSPTPQSGSVTIVAAARVEETDIPLTKVFSALSARGMGLGEMVTMKR